MWVINLVTGRCFCTGISKTRWVDAVSCWFHARELVPCLSDSTPVSWCRVLLITRPWVGVVSCWFHARELVPCLADSTPVSWCRVLLIPRPWVGVVSCWFHARELVPCLADSTPVSWCRVYMEPQTVNWTSTTFQLQRRVSTEFSPFPRTFLQFSSSTYLEHVIEQFRWRSGMESTGFDWFWNG
jgi:hypothetical protein